MWGGWDTEKFSLFFGIARAELLLLGVTCLSRLAAASTRTHSMRITRTHSMRITRTHSMRTCNLRALSRCSSRWHSADRPDQSRDENVDAQYASANLCSKKQCLPLRIFGPMCYIRTMRPALNSLLALLFIDCALSWDHEDFKAHLDPHYVNATYFPPIPSVPLHELPTAWTDHIHFAV